MAHLPAWHILDNHFPQKDRGLQIPTRNTGQPEYLVCRSTPEARTLNTLSYGAPSLRIENLDRADPPNYTSGSFPRSSQFNRNVYSISAEPRMPEIEVHCETVGFDPGDVPIHWRLQCLHMLCRHVNTGHYRYRGACERLYVEWQGRSRRSGFRLFHPESNLYMTYDYNSNNPEALVMGGHAILSVAAAPPGCISILEDHVHLRIVGTNPDKSNVLQFVEDRFRDRSPNIRHMLRAVFAHESNFVQFKDMAQTHTVMNFRQKHHNNDASQSDCAVTFDWPDDPPHFPFVTFDFGVGISQYTKIEGRTIEAATAWDWRENIRTGANEFMGTLRAAHQPGLTWRQWAWQAWRRYNGSGPQAEQYADTLRNSDEGQQVSSQPIPHGTDWHHESADLPASPSLGCPPSWPSIYGSGDFPWHRDPGSALG